MSDQETPPPVAPGAPAPATPEPAAQTTPEKPAKTPEQIAARKKRTKRVVAIAAAVALVGANVGMYLAIDGWKTQSATAIDRATELGGEIADAQTTSAQLEASIELLEGRAERAANWLSLLEDDVAGESADTTKWRDVAEALASCNKKRAGIAKDLRKGSVGNRESAANKQCNTALSDYRGLGS